MAKQIFFNDESKSALEEGVNKVAGPVGSTMGAAGKTVVISNHYNLDPIVTKDGVTVASCILLPDPKENVGARLVRNAAEATAKEAGDGTTQTVVLAQYIIKNGLKAVREGASPQRLKAGIERGVKDIVNKLKALSVPVKDNDTIKAIATISANNDDAIGSLIADAYKKIGNNGVMVIEKSNSIDTVIEVLDGVQVPKGFISPDFVNDKAKQRVVYDEPLYIVADYTISTMYQLAPIFTKLDEQKSLSRPIIIIASDFEGEAFSSMLHNFNKGSLKVCLVKAPSIYRRHHLDDIAVATGATLICDENGLKVEDLQLEHLGTSEKVVITENLTCIVGGDADEKKLKDQINAISVQAEDYGKDGNLELKEIWEQRLGRLTGSIGVIKVGGSTEVEMKERRDRVDDACRAVKSSIEEGVVLGGGVALLNCAQESGESTGFEGEDDIMGYALVLGACTIPLKRMLENAGLDIKYLTEMMEKVKGGDAKTGFNIKTKQFEDFFETGVLDPAKVIRCAVQNAASVAICAITSDYLLVEM